MAKWQILTAVGIVSALCIYALNSWLDQINSEKSQENQEFISKQIKNESNILEKQIDDKFYELDAKRNIASNRTQQLIITEVENILHNLTDHRKIANLTYDNQNENNRLLKHLILTIQFNANKSLYNQEHFFLPWQNETFQKLFKALNITDTSSNFTLNGKNFSKN